MPSLRHGHRSDEDSHPGEVGKQRRAGAPTGHRCRRRWSSDLRAREGGSERHVGSLVLRELQHEDRRLGRGVRTMDGRTTRRSPRPSKHGEPILGSGARRGSGHCDRTVLRRVSRQPRVRLDLPRFLQHRPLGARPCRGFGARLRSSFRSCIRSPGTTWRLSASRFSSDDLGASRLVIACPRRQHTRLQGMQKRPRRARTRTLRRDRPGRARPARPASAPRDRPEQAIRSRATRL